MIGLMDCNNFFVSCERLFRPDLFHKPVAVLSSNDGCIVSRSQEVKDMGISMGVPHFQIKDICRTQGVTLFSSNFALYRDISRRVMQALREEFSLCEVYSIDEAFFEVPDECTEEMLMAVRRRIIQKTGIPVSIGVANTKTLAKIASKEAKSGSGVYIIDAKQDESFLHTMSCGSVWGIGRKTSAMLTAHGVHTVAEFLALDRVFVRQNLGIVGERLLMELAGTSVYPLGTPAEHGQESYTSTRSFAKPAHDIRVVMSALGYHVTQVAEKLRLHNEMATRMSIIARGSRFGDFSHREGSAHVVFETPTHDTTYLLQEASKLLESIYDAEVPYKKAGVVLSGIVPCAVVSESLFADSTHQQKRKGLDVVVDAINRTHGRGTVLRGVAHAVDAWKDRRELLSKEYTTKWDDIVTVKAV